MSLRVWLPLNGTLDNQGLDDIVVTNNGATIDNSGKIGKCYSFDGSDDYISFPYSFPTIDWSYSIWFYTTSTNTQTLGCCRNGVGFGFSIFLISNKIRIDGIVGNDNQQWTTTYTYPTNTWINLIVTSKNGLIKYYINGEYQASKNVTVNNTKLGNIFTIGASQTNGSGLGNYFKGKINDFRIYDHALSSMEVKQISQGLILHYPLNNNGWGQKNLLAGTNREFISGNEFNKTLDLAPIFDNYGLVPYTISFDLKSADISNRNIIMVYCQNGSGARYSISQKYINNVTTEYKRYAVTVTPVLDK